MGKRKTKEEYDSIKADLIANYADTPTIDFAQKYDMHYNAVLRLAHSLGLKKSELGRIRSLRQRLSRHASFQKNHPERWKNLDKGSEYRFQPGVNIVAIIGGEKAAVRREKINNSRRKTIESEKRRIKYGMKQLTKIPFAKYPPNTMTFIRRLREKGYTVDEKKMIAYFDDNTTRCPVIEARKPGDKYYRYMRFMPTSNYISR